MLDFIKLKTDLNKVTKANISIRLSDEFMEAVKEHKQFRLHFKRQETGQVIESLVNAADVFRLVAETNWDYAEPGAFSGTASIWNLLLIRRNFPSPVSIPVQKNPCRPAVPACWAA